MRLKGRGDFEICEQTEQTEKYVSIYEKQLSEETAVNDTYDIVVANISAKIIIELTYVMSNLIPVNGRIVLSGILKESLNKVETELNANRIFIDRISTIDDWVGILATKLD